MSDRGQTEIMNGLGRPSGMGACGLCVSELGPRGRRVVLGGLLLKVIRHHYVFT